MSDDQPRDETGRFAAGPDPSSIPDEPSGPVDPKDAFWNALSDRDKQDLAVEAMLRQTGYLGENGFTEKAQRWLYNQPAENYTEYEEYEDPYQQQQQYPPQQEQGQYVTYDQLQQLLYEQRMQEQAEWEQYEAQQREEQRIAELSQRIEQAAPEYADIHKESMLFHSLRLQQQHPYMSEEDIVRNVKSEFDQAERERLAAQLPAGSQAAPSSFAPPTTPPTGVPASPNQQPMTIAEASRIAREQGMELRTGF